MFVENPQPCLSRFTKLNHRKENDDYVKTTDSVLFHYLERSIEYDAGIAVDYYDEIGNDSIITYPNGDAILEHIQNIRVLDIQYN